MTISGEWKIYHIVHVDRLPSIIQEVCLWSDREVIDQNLAGTGIGMGNIKRRRLEELTLSSHPGLYVGNYVPFYFCPRSIMLYLLHRGNHRELDYRGGQDPIIHLRADLSEVVTWAEENNKRWAFTTANAGTYYFDDYNQPDLVNEMLNREAIDARNWSGANVPEGTKEGKQAEFLLETQFPWQLIERIGVYSTFYYRRVINLLSRNNHRPPVEIKRDWYY